MVRRGLGRGRLALEVHPPIFVDRIAGKKGNAVAIGDDDALAGAFPCAFKLVELDAHDNRAEKCLLPDSLGKEVPDPVGVGLDFQVRALAARDSLLKVRKIRGIAADAGVSAFPVVARNHDAVRTDDIDGPGIRLDADATKLVVHAIQKGRITGGSQGRSNVGIEGEQDRQVVLPVDLGVNSGRNELNALRVDGLQ